MPFTMIPLHKNYYGVYDVIYLERLQLGQTFCTSLQVTHPSRTFQSSQQKHYEFCSNIFFKILFFKIYFLG